MSNIIPSSSPQWTAQQRAAIEHVAGDLLVSAAAGSGKTAVLAQRCARLVCDIDPQDGGCSVDNLLVLTFTEAAANEMRSRIAQAIHAKLQQPEKRSAEKTRWLKRQAAMVDRAAISTLHAFCARVLRQHFHEIPGGLDPAFQVLDEDEARLLREETLSDLLAAWHNSIALRGNARPSPSSDFADFFEAYAQGRESICREMLLSVHRTLESTADPAAYLARTRDLYSPEGRNTTLHHFLTQTLAAQVHLANLAAQRACAVVQEQIGPCPMLIALQGAQTATQESLRQLQAADFYAARAALDFAWPARLSGMKDLADFDVIKKQTYTKIKDRLGTLLDQAFALPPEKLLADLADLARPLETLLTLTADFSTAYTAAKRRQNRVDFADLERLTLNLLTVPASLAADELRRRYRHLLVDEFQDINPLQAALLEALRSTNHFPHADQNPGNLFVVGDVKQSIYTFRHAEPQLFLDREAASKKSQRYVSLPHNFRSHPSLLTAMNALFEKILTQEIAGLTYNDGHALQPAPSPSPIPTTQYPVELHLAIMKDKTEPDDDSQTPENSDDDAATAPPRENLSAIDAEARMVADRIAALIAENRTLRLKDGSTRPLQYRDLAILLRTMKNKALLFARALSQRGIPVHADLSAGYFDAPEVAATLNLLHVLDNPQQDIPLAGALLSPYNPTPFTHDDLSTIRLAYDRKLAGNLPFHEAVARYAAEFHTDLAQRLNTFLATLTRWREALRTRPLHEGLATLYADSRIFPYLAGLDAGTQKTANLHALHQRALKFSASRGGNNQGLHRFLRFIDQLRDQEADYGEAPVLSEASNVVRIMSIHKSKGLEFPVVFVSGLGSNFNLQDPGPIYVHRTLGIGLKVADVDRNIFYPSAASLNITYANQRSARAEELRLLYVALTRARDHLILTGHLAKPDPLDTARFLWKNHAAAIPEDALLKARSPLEWLLPALASSNLAIQWPDESMPKPQLTITTHAPSPTPPPASAVPTLIDPTITLLQSAQPLSAAATANFDHLFSRLTGQYAHDLSARQPAVVSVTQLKNLADHIDEEDAPSRAIITEPATPRSPSALEARDRGIATHRILELLNFAACSPEEVAAQIKTFVSSGQLTAAQEKTHDRPGIAWFLASPIGLRLGAAAKDPAYQIRREIPFAWPNPAPDNPSPDPADWPTIRGVIDLLLIHKPTKTAEILDYKTDSAFTWKTNLPQYQSQMHYYLRAAGDILPFPVARATLLFLTVQQLLEVTLPPESQVARL